MGISHKRKRRIAVIGGGITGTFAAFFLARLGAQVILIERGEIGDQASGSNTGGLNPLVGAGIPGALQDFALESMRLHRESWEDIERLSGSPLATGVVSRLYVAIDGSDADALETARELHKATPGYSARWLEPAELRRSQPLVTHEAAGALLTEGNVRVDPKPYVAAVAAAAIKMGARVERGSARGLNCAGGIVTEVMLESASVPCDGVVIAPGPWCEEPSTWLGTTLPVEPVKGELVLVDVDGQRPDGDVTWGTVGMYTSAAGAFWLGGTEDRVGYDATPTAEGRARIIAGISRLMPGLGRLRTIRHVAGLRPMTPNDLPIVGVPDGWDNVCIAVGGGRKGMLLGAGLGFAAAELLLRGKTSLSVDGYSPAGSRLHQQAR